MDEQPKASFDWKRTIITVAIILVTAGVVGGTVWYIMDQNAKSIADSNAKSEVALQKQIDELNKNTKVNSENATANDTSNQDALDQTVIKQLVSNFESAYKNAYLGQSGVNRVDLLNSMFAYMTEPVTQSDKDLKSTLMYGKDLSGNPGGPVLFSTGGTDEYTLTYTLGDITKNSNGYTVKVTESKKKYYNGDNPPGYKDGIFMGTFEITKQGNTWLINKYYNPSNTDKYSGFGN